MCPESLRVSAAAMAAAFSWDVGIGLCCTVGETSPPLRMPEFCRWTALGRSPVITTGGGGAWRAGGWLGAAGAGGSSIPDRCAGGTGSALWYEDCGGGGGAARCW